MRHGPSLYKSPWHTLLWFSQQKQKKVFAFKNKENVTQEWQSSGSSSDPKSHAHSRSERFPDQIMPINGKMDRPNVIRTYNGVSLRLQKESNSNMGYNVDATWEQYMLSKISQTQIVKYSMTALTLQVYRSGKCRGKRKEVVRGWGVSVGDAERLPQHCEFMPLNHIFKNG